MKPDCQCRCCKHDVDEFFCIQCGHNFNECESFHKFDGITLCPKCHPEDWECPKNLISEWGGNMRCFTSDGRIVNMADELNRLENEKFNTN